MFRHLLILAVISAAVFAYPRVDHPILVDPPVEGEGNEEAFEVEYIHPELEEDFVKEVPIDVPAGESENVDPFEVEIEYIPKEREEGFIREVPIDVPAGESGFGDERPIDVPAGESDPERPPRFVAGSRVDCMIMGRDWAETHGVDCSSHYMVY